MAWVAAGSEVGRVVVDLVRWVAAREAQRVLATGAYVVSTLYLAHIPSNRAGCMSWRCKTGRCTTPSTTKLAVQASETAALVVPRALAVARVEGWATAEAQAMVVAAVRGNQGADSCHHFSWRSGSFCTMWIAAFERCTCTGNQLRGRRASHTRRSCCGAALGGHKALVAVAVAEATWLSIQEGGTYAATSRACWMESGGRERSRTRAWRPFPQRELKARPNDSWLCTRRSGTSTHTWGVHAAPQQSPQARWKDKRGHREGEHEGRLGTNDHQGPAKTQKPKEMPSRF